MKRLANLPSFMQAFLFVVFRRFPDWGWEKLLESYLASPYLTLDNQAISSYINPDEQISLTTNSEEASLEYSEFDEIPRKVLHV